MLNFEMSVPCPLEKLCNDYSSVICFCRILMYKSSLWKILLLQHADKFPQIKSFSQTHTFRRAISSKMYSFKNNFTF